LVTTYKLSANMLRSVGGYFLVADKTLERFSGLKCKSVYDK